MGDGEVTEVEVCVELFKDGTMEGENSLKSNLKRNFQCILVGTEAEPCAKKQAKEAALNDSEFTPCADNPTEEALHDVEIESFNHTASEPGADGNFADHAFGGTDLKLSPKSHTKEVSIEDVEECDTLQAQDDCSLSAKKHVKEVSDDNELENGVKEASNEDIFSEVSDPNVPPGDITSGICEIGTHSKELGGSNAQHGYADVSSLCSLNSCSDENLSEREHTGNDASGEVSASCVVLEIPKHVSTTGIRKITFKFSKSKADYENRSSILAAPPVFGGYDGGSHEVHTLNPSVDDDVNRDMYLNNSIHETRVPFSFARDLEFKLSTDVLPDSYPANVKKLLSTGILEGAHVKYISINGETELSGIIWDDGYLCSCSSCNFSRVLSAYEFELHAGVKTRHPNNHIYLENGKPVYSIIQELKTAPLRMIDEVIKEVAGPSLNEEKFQAWKASLQQNNLVDHADVSTSGQPIGFYNSNVSYPYPSQILRDKLTTSSFCYANDRLYQDNCTLTGEHRKRVIKKPGWLLTSSESDVELEKYSEGGMKKRDNDLHRLLFLPNGLPDGTDLAYYSKGKKILGGYKQGNGIVCSCCHIEISPSQFEAHAGYAAKRQPYHNICTSSGLTLHDIALMLVNGRSITSSNSDDMCAVCGDRGDLISCDGCPRAFHAACLGLQSCPSNGWHCPCCLDKSIPARKASGRPVVMRQTRVVKAPQFVGGGCVVCRAPDFSVAKFDDRTVLLCDQCEKEFHVGCLRERGLCDLKELPNDKWFCCNDCNMIHKALQNFVQNGVQLVPAAVSAKISKKHEEKGPTDIAVSDVQWRILSGKSRRPEHLPLLSRASAIFRECFDPIVAKSGQDLIPIMVYGRNISGQEFGGMYCIVLIVKSIVVSAGLLRILGREVAELPLVATSRENQGKGYFQALFSCIERLLFSMDVKTLVLPAAEEAESIWTKKFGFRKMSNVRVSKYTRDIQFTIFKGTTMLEKEVHWTGH